jgi:hypothetical protein
MTGRSLRPVPGRPAWTQLRAMAAEARERRDDGLGDWDPGDIDAALIAVETAGWSWRRALAEVTRMLGDPDATPGDLRAAVMADARAASGTAYTREEREELRALAIGNCEAATERFKHPTGPQPVLGPGPPEAGDPP